MKQRNDEQYDCLDNTGWDRCMLALRKKVETLWGPKDKYFEDIKVSIT